jgi:hypothetical protein
MPRGVKKGKPKGYRITHEARQEAKSNLLEALKVPEMTDLIIGHPEYEKVLASGIAYANTAFEVKELKQFAIKWASVNGFDAFDFKKVPDDEFCHIGKLFWIELQGGQISDRIVGRVSEILSHIRDKYFGVDSNGSLEFAGKERRSAQDTLRENAFNLIADFEEAIDKRKFVTEPLEMLKSFEGGFSVPTVHSYYNGILEELEDVQSDDCDEQLKEAYKSVHDFDTLFEMVSSIVTAVEAFSNVKSATRKPRKKKTIAPEKIVSKVQVLSHSPEFNVSSVEPVKLLGAKHAWVFNVRYRKLGIYHASTDKGFGIAGTTIQDFDEATSYCKIVRHAETVLPKFLKGGSVEQRRIFDALKTLEVPLTGRLNSDTLILKVWS